MTATLTAPPAACPKCGNTKIFDNRGNKTNPKSPDLKCGNPECDWRQWPPKPAPNGTRQQAPAKQPVNHGDLPGDPAPVDFPSLCTRYAECVGYVAKTIVPGLVKLDIGTDPQSVAAMVACLWIERNRRNV